MRAKKKGGGGGGGGGGTSATDTLGFVHTPQPLSSPSLVCSSSALTYDPLLACSYTVFLIDTVNVTITLYTRLTLHAK